MRRLLQSTVIACVVGALVSPVRADDEAKKIVEKAITAHGGKDRIEKYKAIKSKAKGVLSILGMELEFTSETAFQFPDRARTTMKAEIMGTAMTIEQVIKGDKVSMSLNGMNQPIPDGMKNELRNGVLMQRIMNLTPLVTDKDFTLKSLGESKVDDAEVVGIQVDTKEVKDIKIYFDKKSNLLVKIERMGADPTGAGEVKQEMYLTDYKEFEGIKRPTKTVMKQNGTKMMESTTSEQKLLEKLDDKDLSD